MSNLAFEGERGNELFDPHPFAWKTPTPPGSLQARKAKYAIFSHAQKTNLRGSGHSERERFKVAIFPVSLGENRISQGVEDWGSLIFAALSSLKSLLIATRAAIHRSLLAHK